MDSPALEKSPAFEEFTDYVCKGILSARKKAEVKEELWSHLTDRYEQNLAIGMAHTDAQTDAVEHMGDRQLLQRRMAQLYSVSPSDYMRSSLNFLIFGILFSYVNLNFFVGANQVFTFLGEILTLYALFKLRGVHKRIQTALYIYPTALLLGVAANFCAYYWIDGTVAVSVFQVLSCILQAVFYGFLFAGLHTACKSVQTEGEKEPHLGFCCFLMLSILGFGIAVITLQATGDDFSLLAYLLIGEILIILFGLRRAKLILMHREPEFPLEKSLQKQDKALYSVLVVFFLALPFLGMYLAAARQPEATVYAPADTTESVQTVQEARAHMLSLGFPADRLADLPDSEVLQYKNALCIVHDPYYEEEIRLQKDDEPQFEIYHFCFPCAESPTETAYVRTIYCLTDLDAQKRHFRDGLYIQYDNRDFHTPGTADKSNAAAAPVFLVLSEYNGVTLRSAPLAMYSGADFPQDYTGAEFAFPKASVNRRVYYAQTQIWNHPDVNYSSCIFGYYLHKDWPMYPLFSNTVSAAEALFHSDWFSPSDPTYAVDYVYSTMDFHPEYFGLPAPPAEGTEPTQA